MEYLNAIYDPRSQAYLEYRQIIQTDASSIWRRVFTKEMNRLLVDTETIRFIKREAILKDKKPTSIKINCDYRPQKEDPYRARITVGGNLIFYSRPTATPASDITTIKSIWNSKISSEGSKYTTMDIKDFYLYSNLKK